MTNPIVFRRNTDIGAADAESDEIYLEQCFIDTGDIDALLDCNNPKCIVIGRTGSGKTALLNRVIKSADNVIELAPEALALSYVNNSTVLRFFEEAGVSLDAFYSLLWRHIITVELLKARYEINNTDKQHDFLDRMKGLISKDKAKERGLKYITEWGDRFWEETEYRTKEFTRKLETELSGSAKVDVKYLSLGAEGVRKLSEDELIEVRDRGMRVVNEVQVKELHDVINLLSENIFDDSQRKYYIVIDRLDESWVEDHLRFRLIKALLEAVRSFKKVRPVKIIVALRTDLHHKVISETVSPGFQEEKYRSLYLNLKWTRPQLANLLDQRVHYMFKRQYSGQKVGIAEILPTNQIDQRSAVDYLIDRTFFRPREAIIFVNECISRAEGTSKITVQLLRQAEVSYSRTRVISLADEWRRDYPNLQTAVSFLERRETPFSINDVAKEDADRLASSLLENEKVRDPLTTVAEAYFLGGKLSQAQFLEEVVNTLYLVGLLGVKPQPHLGRQWSYIDHPTLTKGQLQPSSMIDIHKTFWAALGVYRKGKGAYLDE